LTSAVWEPEQNHASGQASSGVDQIAKIAIFGDEYTPFSKSAIEHLVIGGAGGGSAVATTS